MKAFVCAVERKCHELGLPHFYSDDLTDCLVKLESQFFMVEEWVLLLRTHGADLIPCGVGASDSALRIHGDIKVILTIDTHHKTITQIDKEKALKLINVLPCSHSEAKKKHKSIIRRGLTLGLWGLFETPTFEQLEDPADALKYFKQCRNTTMIAHCQKLVDLNKQHLS